MAILEDYPQVVDLPQFAGSWFYADQGINDLLDEGIQRHQLLDHDSMDMSRITQDTHTMSEQSDKITVTDPGRGNNDAPPHTSTTHLPSPRLTVYISESRQQASRESSEPMASTSHNMGTPGTFQDSPPHLGGWGSLSIIIKSQYRCGKAMRSFLKSLFKISYQKYCQKD
ncbi:hypothetical protein K432DRAFT_403754 [Lepidopterella palustris CBS 459.81]|uniref:Uncharacterized protein n=1 Tax=Lepidopterella palustris CBS 459.81 TaxID=1314670 RepID=A0A8E2ECG5_9PEZI|nr:hypothetical protein K432DRAFT_403754 [Lepidopterella palustris CBS 459.81]